MTGPCPNCEGLGYTIVTRSVMAHACGGDERRCQVVCPVEEQEQEQERCECNQPTEEPR